MTIQDYLLQKLNISYNNLIASNTNITLTVKATTINSIHQPQPRNKKRKNTKIFRNTFLNCNRKMKKLILIIPGLEKVKYINSINGSKS